MFVLGLFLAFSFMSPFDVTSNAFFLEFNSKSYFVLNSSFLWHWWFLVFVLGILLVFSFMSPFDFTADAFSFVLSVFL